MQTPFTTINQRGIPTIESVNVSLNASSSLVYTFRDHALRNAPYRGLLLVKLQTPPTGGTTEPVMFENVELQTGAGVTVTAADIAGGIYLCYYEQGNSIYVLTGV